MLSLPENSTCYCFADDTKFLSSGYDAFVNCQNDLSLLSNRCADNDLNFNISKCAFIFSRQECSGTLSLDGHLLKRLDTTSDLGLEVSSTLKWDLHIRTKLSRVRNSFNYLRHNAPYSLPSRVKLNFYYACVLSTLLYGSQVWSPDVSHIRLTEKFHLKCLSWCFGKTNYLSLLRCAKCLPISYHLIERDLNLFLAIRSRRSCIQFDNYFTIRQNQRFLLSDTVQHMSSSGYKRNLTGRPFFSSNYDSGQ